MAIMACTWSSLLRVRARGSGREGGWRVGPKSTESRAQVLMLVGGARATGAFTKINSGLRLRHDKTNVLPIAVHQSVLAQEVVSTHRFCRQPVGHKRWVGPPLHVDVGGSFGVADDVLPSLQREIKSVGKAKPKTVRRIEGGR